MNIANNLALLQHFLRILHIPMSEDFHITLFRLHGTPLDFLRLALLYTYFITRTFEYSCNLSVFYFDSFIGNRHLKFLIPFHPCTDFTTSRPVSIAVCKGLKTNPFQFYDTPFFGASSNIMNSQNFSSPVILLHESSSALCALLQIISPIRIPVISPPSTSPG